MQLCHVVDLGWHASMPHHSFFKKGKICRALSQEAELKERRTPSGESQPAADAALRGRVYCAETPGATAETPLFLEQSPIDGNAVGYLA